MDRKMSLIVGFRCDCGNFVITEAKNKDGKFYRDSSCFKCRQKDSLNQLIVTEVNGGIGGWINRGQDLTQKLIAYDWEYRKKICAKCSEEKKKRLKCMAFDSFKDGIQETHCENLVHARTKKFREEIEGAINSHPAVRAHPELFEG